MGLLERMDKARVVQKDDTLQKSADEHDKLRDTVQREVIDLLNRRSAKGQPAAVNEEIMSMLESALEVYGAGMARPEKNKIAREIFDEMCGLGPLEPLIADTAVSEIMVNGPKLVYVERGGRLSLTGVTFRDEQHVRDIIDRIVSPLGGILTRQTPWWTPVCPTARASTPSSRPCPLWGRWSPSASFPGRL